jgi:hypothetical protein
MNPFARKILATIAGFVVGGVVNPGLATNGIAVVPVPERTDVSTMEAVRECMKLLPPKNFGLPWCHGWETGPNTGFAWGWLLA